MFTIGDKIVYPMHGAGIIEEIEEKKILGEIRKYYILNVPCGDMKIMIPVDSSREIGIRAIVSDEELAQAMDILRDKSSEMSSNWNRRYRENMEKLKTGDVLEVAEVVRNLMRTDREKKLSTGEKKMLTNARQILSSEIILIKGIDMKEANNIIDRAV
ncbi:MAG: CarD family transcriptional regulator [Oscillospiraceae bacterium]|nr:CarD family transcriptional regulator [Oscillospiraceae bacterium]